MNKKGQMDNIGKLIVLFVGLIVGLALLSGGIFANIGTTTQTSVVNQSTITFGADGTTVDLTGQSASEVVVTNATLGAQVVDPSNYTILNNQVSNGVLTAQIRYDGGNFTNSPVNVSYNMEPDGYIADSGARSMALLIAIMAGLALAIWALTHAIATLRENDLV